MRKLGIILMYVVIPIAAAFASFKAAERYFFAPLDATVTSTSIFVVESDKNFRDIAADLEVNNYIHYRYAIRLLARLQKKDTLVMAGEYEFSPAMSPQQILDAMVDGKMILRNITLKEGVTLREIGPLLEEAGITQRSLFDQALKFTSSLNLCIPSSLASSTHLIPYAVQYLKAHKDPFSCRHVAASRCSSLKPISSSSPKSLK